MIHEHSAYLSQISRYVLVIFARVAFHQKESSAATAWPDHGGGNAADHFQMRLVDLNVDALGDDYLAWADMAFISAMAIQRKSVMDIIDRCKARGLTIVAGGPLFTAQPNDFEKVDHMVWTKPKPRCQPFLLI